MSLTNPPTYVLSDPMFISSRLTPAVKIGPATLSAEASAIEPNGRAHFRFYLDIPGLESWTSVDGFVTVLAKTWPIAVAKALETFTDSFVIDCESEGNVSDSPLFSWVDEHADDFSIAAEDLREWLSIHDR